MSSVLNFNKFSTNKFSTCTAVILQVLLLRPGTTKFSTQNIPDRPGAQTNGRYRRPAEPITADPAARAAPAPAPALARDTPAWRRSVASGCGR
eukprot:SAG31_NODE_287_length_18430_cov_8.127544_12_plen_93_part_00